jgi:hypothetical protein
MAKACIRNRLAKLQNRRRFRDWFVRHRLTQPSRRKSSKLAQPAEAFRTPYQIGRAVWTHRIGIAFSSFGKRMSGCSEGEITKN